MQFDETDGSAALGICESLLLTLIDQEVITKQAALNLLADVATTHANAGALASDQTAKKHKAVVETVQRMMIGKGATAAVER